jgi:hypothetical protein
MRSSQRLDIGVRHGSSERQPPAPAHATAPPVIPFSQRVTCTVPDACAATGLGRTKLYELIGSGAVRTTTIGRRRLVLVSSLLRLMQPDGAAPV